ncbi:MAG: amidohydrolase family protein [Pirellulaceae bacterium]|nr:amidohydrolase family protein [Pirellulaceae bacterium]
MGFAERSCSRRVWLGTATAVGLAGVEKPTSAAEPSQPPTIIDTHTHFYDPTRPEGVPWPGKTDAVLYRPTLPKHFREVAAPLGVTGTIVVEASSWVEDNQWLLDLARDERAIVGIVGHLKPGEPEFAGHLARFGKNPLLRGLRVNQAGLAKGLEAAAYVDDLRRLADADLTLDVNGGPDLLPVVSRTAEKLPLLRIVINHCANLRIDGQPPPAEWLAGMRGAAGHERVWCKLSALVEGAGRGGMKAPAELDFYRPVLDAMWSVWGSDRLLFGSNWPVSSRGASYRQVFDLAADYVQAQGDDAAGKFFVGNSRAAYRWEPRPA